MVSQLKAVKSGSSPTGSRVVSHPLLKSIEGTIQVFTSTHRSFFSNVMVQALHSAGQGMSVLVVQFLKGGIGQGIDHPVQLGQNLDWIRCDLPRCLMSADVTTEEKQQVLTLWEATTARVMQGKYRLVVLDELSLAVNFGLIPEDDVTEFLQKRPPHIDVILTGPDMPEGILDMADQVTQFRRNFFA